jgi:hypothetical protein
MTTQRSSSTLFEQSDIISGLFGGMVLWCTYIVTSEVVSRLTAYAVEIPNTEKAAAYLVTLSASLLAGTALSLAQARLRRQSLFAAILTGSMMSIFAIVGIVAAGINEGASIAQIAIRSAIVLVSVCFGAAAIFFHRARQLDL